MDQDEFVDRITAALVEDPSLEALFLSGSLGRGTSDAVSDVDLIAVVAADAQPAFLAQWRRILEGTAPVVYWAERRMGAALVNAITTDWLRCDLTVTTGDPMPRTAQDLIRPLIDRTGRYKALPCSLPPREPDPGVVAQTIAEFLRVLGLLPVIAHRQEWVTGVAGAGLLRAGLITLLTEQVAEPDRGGALHLSALLDPPTMRMIEALPYPGPTREDVIAAHLGLARAFVPRARALAAQLSMLWPDEFEDATLRALSRELALPAAELW